MVHNGEGMEERSFANGAMERLSHDRVSVFSNPFSVHGVFLCVSLGACDIAYFTMKAGVNVDIPMPCCRFVAVTISLIGRSW